MTNTQTITTANPRPRCQFGRPHLWMLGFYHEGEFIAEDYVKCGNCGQIEED
jgi:hypothetical protein